MEPRPSRPSRPSQPYINTGATPGQPAGAPTGAYGQGGFGAPGAPFDASSAPPAAPPMIGYDPSYSPGQPLAPIDGGRGSRFLAPLLAVAALAIVVAAVAWAIGRARGDDGDDPAVAGANAAVTATAVPAGDDPTAEGGAADEAAAEDGEAEDAGAEDAESTAAATEAPEADGDEPTTDPEAEATSEDAPEEEEPTARPSRERDDARSWLPLTDEVGEGYERTENQVRDLAEVVGSFPDPTDAEAKLTEFGWLENAFREFQLPDGDPAATTVYNISVHRFETAGGAKEALPYFVDGARSDLVDDASDLPDAGDQIRALEGTTAEGGRIFTVYVRERGVVIRVAGTSVEGEPREDVLGLVERIMAE